MPCLAMMFLVAAQVLFTTGVQDAETGKLERARMTLETLVNTYPADPLVSDAKADLEAINLLQEAQKRMQEGRYMAAAFTYQTLLSVYPGSPLEKQARDGMEAAARAEQELNVRLTVRNVDVAALGVPSRAAQQLFVDHEVKLAAGKPFDPRDVEQARLALTAMLGTPVRAEVKTSGAHEVDVVLSRK